MNQTAIPYVFMRGGTSRGPYMRRQDLPEDRALLSQVLLSIMGSGHAISIDGIGGSSTVTTKVAMLSVANKDDWADIDYFFAQVGVSDKTVDYKPTCGNILSGVGAAALELGLLKAPGGKGGAAESMEVKIRAVNTGARVIANLPIADGLPNYQGSTVIDGVPGSAAGVKLQFLDSVGCLTGALLPSGKPQDKINGMNVTCIEVTMPMVIGLAEDFGISGYETASELDDNKELFQRIEAVRLQAGKLMGLGDVAKSVVPKFGLLAKAQHGGDASARYFMPWQCHPGMAVSGAQCLASCLLQPGTVAQGLAKASKEKPQAGESEIVIEHPAGKISVFMDYKIDAGGLHLNSAGLFRTARKLADGHVYVPHDIWDGVS